MKHREEQETLESSMQLEGSAAYLAGYHKQAFSDSQVGSWLIGSSIADLEAALRKHTKDTRWFSSAQRGIFLMLPPMEMALLSLKFLLDRVFNFRDGQVSGGSFPNCISTLSKALGETIVRHFNWYVLRRQNPKAERSMEEFLQGKAQGYRRRAIAWWKQQLQHKDIRLSPEDEASVGHQLLSLTLEHTGIFEVVQVCNQRGTLYSRVYPRGEFLEAVVNHMDQLSWMQPRTLPMICPPDLWTGPYTGGYLTLGLPVVSSVAHDPQKLWELEIPQKRTDVLDRLGGVPFEINRELLPILEEGYRTHHQCLPQSDIGVVFPECPWSTPQEKRHFVVNKPDIVKGYRQQLAVVMSKFFSCRDIGKRLSFLRSLSIAKDYQQYEAIWFPWFMDYRGRMYPYPQTLNPQGDDVARSLLRFHRKAPLTPASPEWRWFLVQGANLYGQDKGSFEERISFIRQNHMNILQSATDTLCAKWWTAADKPWCFLSWALEYKRITNGSQSYSQLPMMRDGKCNGLQHLSLVIRDEQTAALVSLVPSDRPSDIYSKVQEAVECRVPESSYWKNKVTRKLVKRNTMTVPYNVTHRGMGEQLKDELIDHIATRYMTKLDLQRVSELRDYNYASIMDLLGRTTELMLWYNKVSKVLSQQGPIRWTLPDGFSVIQSFPETRTKQVRLEGRKVTINLRVPKDNARQNYRKHLLSLSPNLTHSLDAQHMALWIRSLPADADIWPIHDSFGTSCHTVHSFSKEDGSNEITRALVSLYSSYDLLGHLAELSGLEPPDRGSFDIQEVLRSKYAFG